MKIYLVRHGETDWNREERIQGQADLPLNNQGMEPSNWQTFPLRQCFALR